MKETAQIQATRPHYEILDGLRGVAALLVVCYHIFEGYAFAGGEAVIKGINHGYLAVDFFFILSGFVISYAYDSRWARKDNPLTIKGFFIRRLVRLHPMVILGAVIGAITFLIQGSVQWDGTHIATSAVMLALLAAMFLIPAVPGGHYEVRGNGEMYPLNGPSWSLFFEYIGNILYALFIRRFSDKVLKAWTAILGILFCAFAVFDVSGYGSVGVGWTLDKVNFFGGLLRMLFPFSLGMLLSRKFKPFHINGAFWKCSLLLAVALFIPYLGARISAQGLTLTLNGAYEFLCVSVIFPMIVLAGASGALTDGASGKICRTMGEISYPLYLVHYPFMYLFYSWLIEHQLFTFRETWLVATGVVIWNVVLAWFCVRFYETPVRKWLGSKLK
ncbi:MAG: acyltransferase family protein [Candidatus Cryptobacteroides sp.]